jgi:hypothetical protein
MNKLLQVGDLRTFTDYPNRKFIIKDVLENPDIKMKWVWVSCVCPHCKEVIHKEVEHSFTRIEILIDEIIKLEEMDIKDLKINDVVIIGDTTDGKKMAFSKDKFKEVYSKSSIFKVLGD